MAPAATELPRSIADATEHQAGASAALAAALASPSHAYLFTGPRGAGKAAAARAFAAELLAAGAADPDDARRRALADPPAQTTPRAPGAGRSPTRRHTPTSSGCGRRGPSIWSRRSASG